MTARAKFQPTAAYSAGDEHLDTRSQSRSEADHSEALPGPRAQAPQYSDPGRKSGPCAEPVKAAHARRVIHLLNFFNDVQRGVGVQEISRCLGWPQSSTSELVASLVEIGVLYKMSGRRLYVPTPGAAWLGLGAQPPEVRSGALHEKMETLASKTGITTALIGMVGLHAQIFSWRRGDTADAVELRTGMQTPLADSAAGWLLLSTLSEQLRAQALHRLRAEAPDQRKCEFNNLAGRVADYARSGSIWGSAGFLPNVRLCAVLTAAHAGRPLVLAFLFDRSAAAPVDLLSRLKQAVAEASSADRPICALA